MLFTGIANPEQLKVLATALEEYCRANDVKPGTPAYERAGCRIVEMFNRGVFDADELMAGLGESRPVVTGEAANPAGPG